MSSAGGFHLLSLMLVAACCGCGQDSCRVRGRVTLDGEPLDNGRIAIQPVSQLASGRPISVPIHDGRFDFSTSQSIMPGVYRVAISAWRPTGNQLQVDEAEPLDEHEQYLPATYNSASKLTADIQGNTSGLLFELRLPTPTAEEDTKSDGDEPLPVEPTEPGVQ